MTEIDKSAPANLAMPGLSTDAKLNYAIASVVVLGALAVMLAVMVW